jgi:hypothetical protein
MLVLSELLENPTRYGNPEEPISIFMKFLSNETKKEILKIYNNWIDDKESVNKVEPGIVKGIVYELIKNKDKKRILNTINQ